MRTDSYHHVMEKPLAWDRRVMLLGYYNMLERAPGNGACIHDTKQYMTVLKARIEMGIDISNEYEVKIKKVISRLYPIDNRKIHSNLLE